MTTHHHKTPVHPHAKKTDEKNTEHEQAVKTEPSEAFIAAALKKNELPTIVEPAATITTK